ncbi:cellulose synthase operon protein YhjQ/BcsQ [Cellulomonas sp. NPDC089187]|uniref:cellulose synthase operon protein YhjQ/BcsQ n=1 Tax=Cellulomonas sp. NPDC089187 TaxID=3154970 RepID=UPI0034237BA7
MGVIARVLASALPERVAQFTALDARVRAPLALSSRIGVVGVSGGAGCSTVAGLLASTLAARREHRVLAVNASAGNRSLLWHAGCTVAAGTTAERDATRRAARSGAEVTAGLVRTPVGLCCLDLAEDTGPVAADRWWRALGPAGRFFDLVVTDWGARSGADIGAAVSASSVLCVVAEAERGSLQHAVDLAAATGLPAVIAAVDLRGARPRWLRELAERSMTPVVPVPHDPGHGSPRPLPSARLSAASSLAVLTLAAALVDAATPVTASAAHTTSAEVQR